MPGAHGPPLAEDPLRPVPSPAYGGAGATATLPGSEAPPQPRGRLRAALATARPRQWIKNGLVIAAAGAAGALGHDDVPVRVLVAFGAFCLLASGIYCLNDVRDASEDRLHPRKRHRPVAAGALSSTEAVLLGVVLIAGGLVASALITPLLALVAVGYLTVTITYTFIWRRILFVDVVAIASGFVLRAVAGGVAAPVELSRWFVLVVTFAALFLAPASATPSACARTLAAQRAGESSSATPSGACGRCSRSAVSAPPSPTGSGRSACRPSTAYRGVR